MIRKIHKTVTALVVISAALVVTAGAKAGAFPVTSSGSPGGFIDVSATMTEACYAPTADGTVSAPREIDMNQFAFTKSPAYPSTAQTVQATELLQWSTNGVQWYTWLQSQSSTPTSTDGNISGPLGKHVFYLDPYGGYYYRVRLQVSWLVGSTRVGYREFALDGSEREAHWGARSATLQASGEALCFIP